MKKYISYLIFPLFFLSSCFIEYSDYEFCRFGKVFEKETVSGEYLFSSYGRDPTRFCSFSLSETENNLKNFSKIDEKGFGK